ncbi:hypothetical protein [Streptomyces sp. 3214.6]|uniref:hypothetical protein n=1 Tax=Streptomyces sp. 3214.6 TaxID=1882757 RepID=UPI000909E1F5|nr:hypothetical protein [Streptomyces sp. 3214.6]SHI69273.1 hypothetical protein SAMN05444521_8254 [Streptomyces sp. 3214.6]
MEPTDDRTLPPPAPFMFGCDECVRLLRAFGEMVAADAGCFYEQLAVAAHVAEDHPDEVPPPHTDNCDLCPTYAARADGDPGGLWAQHRARYLFLPEAVARLL